VTSEIKAALQALKEGSTLSKMAPFLYFQMCQQARITISKKKGLSKSLLAWNKMLSIVGPFIPNNHQKA
jgi:hypothetical protein